MNEFNRVRILVRFMIVEFFTVVILMTVFEMAVIVKEVTFSNVTGLLVFNILASLNGLTIAQWLQSQSKEKCS